MAFGVYNECRVVVRTVVLSQAGRAVVLSAMRHCSSMELVDGLARACTECEMEALAWRVCTSISKVQQELVSLARKPVTHRLRALPPGFVALRSRAQGFVTLHPIQYRSEVELSGSSDIAAAACRRLRRANSVGVDQSNAEWGRFSL